MRRPSVAQVSTLLLGLVDLSAKRYLGRSLAARLAPSPSPTSQGDAGTRPSSSAGPSAAAATVGGAAAEGGEAGLKEEERAAAFWAAPFMLFVQVTRSTKEKQKLLYHQMLVYKRGWKTCALPWPTG